jgi:hypothetical protein
VVNAVAYSPDGAKIASTSADRSVRLRTAVVSCAFSPTGKYLLTASNYGERKIKLWYTDMPHMAEKQQVGFRIVWEATGVMRLITVKYEPKAGFFSDVKAAQAEVDAEDVADAAWAQEHPNDGLPQGKLRFPFAMRPSTLGYPYCNGRLCCAKAALADDDDDDARKAALAEKELERAALELPDTAEQGGFSISVNSVDRFGRQSQVAP